MTKNKANLIAIKTKVAEIMNENARHSKELKHLQGMMDSKVYALDHITELRDAEFLEHNSKDYAMREELKNRVDSLFDSLVESKANINNANFQNALQLIGMLGKEMDGKTLNDLITNFRGQIAELNLLKKACKSARIGNCIAVFDDYTFDAGHQEAWKKQVDNLLIFARSFNITSEILGEEISIDAETVSADAGRAFNNNKMVL